MSQEMEQRQKLAGLWPDQRQRVDKTLRLWESAVLLPLRWTKHGWEILFEVRAANMSWQRETSAFPEAIGGFGFQLLRHCLRRPGKNWASRKTKSRYWGLWTISTAIPVP